MTRNRYYKAELKLSCNELDKSNNWQITERQEKNKYRSALEEIREELCKGRTFYKGYFDNENLSRTDKVIKKINEVLNDK